MNICYVIPGIQLITDRKIFPFSAFESKKEIDSKVVKLVFLSCLPKNLKVIHSFKHPGLNVDVLEEGWLYSLPEDPKSRLLVSSDYDTLYAEEPGENGWELKLLPLIRTALECARASLGMVSLHCSCVEVEGKAVCFTAPSGTGKSTRAQSWVDAFDVQLVSGDRPTLYREAGQLMISGAPWDGKEQIYRNVQMPVQAICDIRRSEVSRVRKLSVSQVRRILMKQCFVPMWDTETASSIMASIMILASRVPMYRVLCGPDQDAAREIKEILFEKQDQIQEIEKDMKIKNGFVLRKLAGEYIVMPTNQNIEKFDGAIVLNAVSAFVWEKLQQSVSREELLAHILSEFEVDEAVAAKDLDILLDRFRTYDVLEDEDK